MPLSSGLSVTRDNYRRHMKQIWDFASQSKVFLLLYFLPVAHICLFILHVQMHTKLFPFNVQMLWVRKYSE